MTTGRTYWWAKDSGWWRREIVVALGEEFGPAGPAVLDWLSCEAKAQNDGGTVKAGKRSLARGTFVDLVTVGHVLSRAVTLGGLEDFEDGELTFVCRISGWRSDQERGQSAARKAEQRARENATDSDNPPEHTPVTKRDMSRSVTECPTTEQNRTGQTLSQEVPVDAAGSTEPAGTEGEGADVLDLDAWGRRGAAA